MASRRADRVRAFARGLEQRFGGRFDTAYDTGPRWRLDWVDGPGEPAVHKLADGADLAGAELRRRYSTPAIAVTAIRMKTAGRLDRYDGGRYPQEIVEWEARDLDHPDRGADSLQDTMAELLIAAAKATAQTARAQWEANRPQHWAVSGGSPVPLDATETAVDLVRTRGIRWLVEQAADAGVELPPLTVLSARYAHAAPATAQAWRERAQPLPLQAAVDAALADQQIDPAAAAALLALLPELQAGWARTEAAIRQAAHAAGVPAEHGGGGGHERREPPMNAQDPDVSSPRSFQRKNND
jgi:hypothetical protein